MKTTENHESHEMLEIHENHDFHDFIFWGDLGISWNLAGGTPFKRLVVGPVASPRQSPEGPGLIVSDAVRL